jgi:hypothetical protein
MGRRKTEVYSCDAPGCPVRDVQIYDTRFPRGYSGKAVFVLDDGGPATIVDWYACSKDHIEPAISWALKIQHEEDWR